MIDLNQYKVLMLAGLTGYIGTLLRGLPTAIINFCFYWFGFTINASTDIGWDSYLGVYMGIRKIVPKNKKYYNHMGGLMKIKTPTNIYLNVNTHVDGYEYLSAEEQEIINTGAEESGVMDFLDDKKEIHCFINRIKALPTGSHLIYLGNLTWIRISAVTQFKQNSSGSSQNRDNGMDDDAKPNHSVSVAVFGLSKKKIMKIFKDSNKWWTNYMDGNLFRDNEKVKDIEGLKKYLLNKKISKYIIINTLGCGYQPSVYKPVRTFDSIFINNKADVINALKRFLCTDQLTEYTRLQIPYKLNILLHGKPGTGKTSIIYALANEFTSTNTIELLSDISGINTPVFNKSCIPYIFSPLTVNYKQHTLEKLPNLSFKLQHLNVIEEIDTMIGSSAASNRDSKTYNTTSFEEILSNASGKLKTLLEWLDGTKTPFGNVCICTTNHIENLDPAIVRRFDFIFHIDGIGDDTIDEMLNYYGFDRSVLDKFSKSDYLMDNGLVNPSKLSNLLINEIRSNLFNDKRLDEFKGGNISNE